MAGGLSPDPSVIGSVPEAPFVLLPDPQSVFSTRARRFAFLAESSNLGDYLRFLAALSGVQADLVASLPPVAAVRMARIDRVAPAGDPALDTTLTRLCDGAKGIDMPETARVALDAVSAAGPSDRVWMFLNLADDHIPADATAPHLFAAAAWQVHLTRLAATLQADDLTPLATGLCPACGGRPVTSSVIADETIENVRYCTCATCATRWNEVRIKCMTCGSTKGLSYRSVETHEATVKAECCTECQSWLKILYQTKNPSLDPVADDVGSLGLDLMMRETGLRRGGFHPFVAGF